TETHQHQTHYPTTLVKGENIRDNRHRNGTDHATEQAGHYSSGHQHGITGRKTAKESSNNESGIEEQQEFFSIETIGKSCGQESRNSGTEGVGRNGYTKFRRF